MMISRQNNLFHQQQIWSVGKILLAVLLVGFVMSQTSLDDLSRTWKQLNFYWLLPSITLFLGSLVITAARAWELIERKANLRAIFILTLIQSVVGNLLASSAGTISFVTLMKLRHNVSITQGIGSIIVAKLGDLFTLMLLLGIGSALVWPYIEVAHSAIFVLLIALIGGVLSGYTMIIFRSAALQYIHAIATRWGLLRFTIMRKFLTILNSLAQEDQQRLKHLFRITLIYSIFYTVNGLFLGYCNFHLLGMPLTLEQLIFYTSTSQLIAWVPIGVFGGLGIFEVTSSYLLQLLGLSATIIIPTLLTARIYFYMLNLGLLPLLLLDRKPDTKRTPPTQQIPSE